MIPVTCLITHWYLDRNFSWSPFIILNDCLIFLTFFSGKLQPVWSAKIFSPLVTRLPTDAFFLNLKECQNNILACLVNYCHVFCCRTVEGIAVLLSYTSGLGSFSYAVCLIYCVAETKEWLWMMSKKEWKNTAMVCLKLLIDISLMGVRIVMNCNYIQYRMEFRIWSLRSANRNSNLYGVYSAKSW